MSWPPSLYATRLRHQNTDVRFASKDKLLSPGDIECFWNVFSFHLRCRETICWEGASLKRLHNCRESCLLTATRRVQFIDRIRFAAAAVAQEVVPVISSHNFFMHISLICMPLTLRLSFRSGYQIVHGFNPSRPCRLTTSSSVYRTHPSKSWGLPPW